MMGLQETTLSLNVVDKAVLACSKKYFTKETFDALGLGSFYAAITRYIDYRDVYQTLNPYLIHTAYLYSSLKLDEQTYSLFRDNDTFDYTFLSRPLFKIDNPIDIVNLVKKSFSYQQDLMSGNISQAEFDNACDNEDIITIDMLDKKILPRVKMIEELNQNSVFLNSFNTYINNIYEESIVLVKNNNDVLPLKKNDSVAILYSNEFTRNFENIFTIFNSAEEIANGINKILIFDNIVNLDVYNKLKNKGIKLIQVINEYDSSQSEIADAVLYSSNSYNPFVFDVLNGTKCPSGLLITNENNFTLKGKSYANIEFKNLSYSGNTISFDISNNTTHEVKQPILIYSNNKLIAIRKEIIGKFDSKSVKYVLDGLDLVNVSIKTTSEEVVLGYLKKEVLKENADTFEAKKEEKVDMNMLEQNIANNEEAPKVVSMNEPDRNITMEKAEDKKIEGSQNYTKKKSKSGKSAPRVINLRYDAKLFKLRRKQKMTFIHLFTVTSIGTIGIYLLHLFKINPILRIVVFVATLLIIGYLIFLSIRNSQRVRKYIEKALEEERAYKNMQRAKESSSEDNNNEASHVKVEEQFKEDLNSDRQYDEFIKYTDFVDSFNSYGKKFGFDFEEGYAETVVSALISSRMLIIQDDDQNKVNAFLEFITSFFGNSIDEIIDGKKTINFENIISHNEICKSKKRVNIVAVKDSNLNLIRSVFTGVYNNFVSPRLYSTFKTEDKMIIIPENTIFVFGSSKVLSLTSDLLEMSFALDIESNSTNRFNVNHTPISAKRFKELKQFIDGFDNIEEEEYKKIDHICDSFNQNGEYYLSNKYVCQLEAFVNSLLFLGATIDEAIDKLVAYKMLAIAFDDTLHTHTDNASILEIIDAILGVQNTTYIRRILDKNKNGN